MINNNETNNQLTNYKQASFSLRVRCHLVLLFEV
jgi:hypothetical protein